jgi:hypothetical protein
VNARRRIDLDGSRLKPLLQALITLAGVAFGREGTAVV